MVFTYDVTTARGKVRLLTNDQEATSHLFADSEIDTFLSLEGDSILRASALALDIVAGNEVLVQKKLTILGGNGVTTDGPSVAKELRAQAATLRVRAEIVEGEENQDDLIDYAEMALEPFGIRERVYNEWARRGEV